MVDASVWATSLLGLWLGVYSVFCCFFLQFCCPLNSKTTHRGSGERVSCCLEIFFMTTSPGPVSFPNSFVSLFVFYILSYLFLKRMGCLSGCLVSSASVQKLFCGSCSAFRWSFDEFVREKVVSLSYFSAILGLPTTPPPTSLFPHLSNKGLTWWSVLLTSV